MNVDNILGPLTADQTAEVMARCIDFLPVEHIIKTLDEALPDDIKGNLSERWWTLSGHRAAAE